MHAPGLLESLVGSIEFLIFPLILIFSSSFSFILNRLRIFMSSSGGIIYRFMYYNSITTITTEEGAGGGESNENDIDNGEFAIITE